MGPYRAIGSELDAGALRRSWCAPLERQTGRRPATLWRRIARKREGLVGAGPERGSPPPWHTDADLGRPIEVVTDMSKSRKLGFMEYQATDDAFFGLFTRLRKARIIP